MFTPTLLNAMLLEAEHEPAHYDERGLSSSTADKSLEDMRYYVILTQDQPHNLLPSAALGKV